MRTLLVLTTTFAALLSMVAALVTPSTAQAGVNNGDRYKVTVTVTNLSGQDGSLITPAWVALHNGGFDVYDRNAPASPGLERLAEDGNTGPLSDEFAGTIGQDATLGGPLAPGESAEMTFLVRGNSAAAAYFSYASMVIPSNDAFVANGDPRAHRLFDGQGNWVAQDFMVYGDRVLDAGTEVNDEVPENTAALAQAAPDTGVVENGVVTSHPGFIPGGNVLAARPGADFTADGAKILGFSFKAETVTAGPARAELRGSNEVPAVDSDAFGYAAVKVNARGELDLLLNARNITGVVAAHIHKGAPGENGPVVAGLFGGGDPVDGLSLDGIIDPASLAEGYTIADLWDLILSGQAYVNVHTTTVPSGELRGQLLVDAPAPAPTGPFTASLRGSNEVPAVASNGHGYARVRATTDGEVSVLLNVRRTDNIVAAHIHAGGPDENGPVIAVLYSATTPADGLELDIVLDDAAFAAGYSAADVLALVATGDTYVNVHTTDVPSGELRGQLTSR